MPLSKEAKKARRKALRVPTAKRDLLPLWNEHDLSDKPVMLFEEFMLLKMSKETYDSCVTEFVEIANLTNR